jgi:hypothetical protein
MQEALVYVLEEVGSQLIELGGNHYIRSLVHLFTDEAVQRGLLHLRRFLLSWAPHTEAVLELAQSGVGSVHQINAIKIII